MERTIRILDNPNADMRTQMQDFSKYGPHHSEAASLKNMIDLDNQMRQTIGFRQRDIYGHYETSNSNSVDPYVIDDQAIRSVKYKVNNHNIVGCVFPMIIWGGIKTTIPSRRRTPL